ncbi:Do family serine endopeptidase [Cupriavidus pinatubonensis]|uniref:Do family serine endopeptidase n=1 Tax=Cupriavidus pinatubonensis TaxID=248026 RepID=UPI00112C6F5C|nr:Do family serine endopeptidase [Cupriavidus pinatubonensis]TPQ31733.1 peptidase [Cupriavidus pinatubonensis]
MVRLIFAGTMIVLAAACTTGSGSLSAQTNPAQQAQQAASTQNTVTGAPDFAAIVDRYGPAVVNISVTAEEQVASQAPPPGLSPGDPLFEFFKRLDPQFTWPEQHAPHLVRDIGSGFIISPDGLILTNAHVVGNAKVVTVKLLDRRGFKARVIGTDTRSDVAVLRINAKDLPTVSIGDSMHVRAGEPVLAIGSPYGFENTATAGIVSATGRSLADETAAPFIQTDVAVNPGNSGGPLFDARGNVIGINTQIYTRTGGYQGLSFAIPIDTAIHIESDLVTYGKVTRGHLGVSVQDVDQGLATAFGLHRVTGALVDQVEPGSPAAFAGIKAGDVVTRVGDVKVEHSAELATLISGLKPGTRTELDLVRNGAQQMVVVTIAALKEKATTPDALTQTKGDLGLTVRRLNKAEANADGIAGGLLVEQASGAAARSGIEAGDVILSVNGAAVSTTQQLHSLASDAGKQVALLVLRNGVRVFVPLDFG